MSKSRNLSRLIVDGAGALDTVNLTNAPNPILAGTIAYFSVNSTPTGWLKANGSAVSRTAYADLFAQIGTTYGVGDGSTTFNLPDLRGEFLRGFDDGRGVDTGRGIGQAQTDQIKSHKHSYNASSGTSSMAHNVTQAAIPGSGVTGTAGAGLAIENTGGTETRPRNVAMLACIKY